MTVDRIQMAVNHAVIRAGVLITVGGARRCDIAQNSLEDIRRICSLLLSDIMRQRYGHSVFREQQRLLSFGGGDQVSRTEFVLGSPPAPVRKLFHGPAEIRLICDDRMAAGLSVIRANASDKQNTEHAD